VGSEPVDGYRFVAARRGLIEKIRERGINDLELMRLFDQVPRHFFLPEGVSNRAYEDAPVPIGFGQTASQPSLQAMMVQKLSPQPTDRVLEIGTGSGYLTALLAHLAERVYSVERNRSLSNRAREVIDRLGFQNVALHVGDGTIGWRKFSPFDVIIVSAASPSVPSALEDQLAEGGRMLIPVGDQEQQQLVMVRRSDGVIVHEDPDIACRFVPLLGRFGWSET